MPRRRHERIHLRPAGRREHVRIGEVLLGDIGIRGQQALEAVAQAVQERSGQAVPGKDEAVLVVMREFVGAQCRVHIVFFRRTNGKPDASTSPSPHNAALHRPCADSAHRNVRTRDGVAARGRLRYAFASLRAGRSAGRWRRPASRLAEKSSTHQKRRKHETG